MSKEKELQKNLEHLKGLKAQLLTARKILEDSGAAMPSKKFFDERLNAFETKLGDLLEGVLSKHGIKTDLKNTITKEFLVEFNKHVLAMTPFSRNKQSKGK